MGAKWQQASDEKIAFTATVDEYAGPEDPRVRVTVLVRGGSLAGGPPMSGAIALPRPILYTDPYWAADPDNDPRVDDPYVKAFHWYHWLQLTVEYDAAHPGGLNVAYVRRQGVHSPEVVGTWEEEAGLDDEYRISAGGITYYLALRDPVAL